MNTKELLYQLEDVPVIAAVKDRTGLERALQSDVRVVFLLYGDLLQIKEMVARIHHAGKCAFIHLDMIDGLSPREAAVDYVAQEIQPDGVITTKPQLVRRAKQLKLLAVQRFFLLDSMAFETIARHMAQDNPDLIEVLPGLMPKVIDQLVRETRHPVIAGGFITEKGDVLAALSAGAVAVSTTDSEVWHM